MNMGLVAMHHRYPLVLLQLHPLDVFFGDGGDHGITWILTVCERECVMNDRLLWARTEPTTNAEFAGELECGSPRHIPSKHGCIFPPNQEVVHEASKA